VTASLVISKSGDARTKVSRKPPASQMCAKDQPYLRAVAGSDLRSSRACRPTSIVLTLEFSTYSFTGRTRAKGSYLSMDLTWKALSCNCTTSRCTPIPRESTSHELIVLDVFMYGFGFQMEASEDHSPRQ